MTSAAASDVASAITKSSITPSSLSVTTPSSSSQTIASRKVYSKPTMENNVKDASTSTVDDGQVAELVTPTSTEVEPAKLEIEEQAVQNVKISKCQKPNKDKSKSKGKSKSKDESSDESESDESESDSESEDEESSSSEEEEKRRKKKSRSRKSKKRDKKRMKRSSRDEESESSSEESSSSESEDDRDNRRRRSRRKSNRHDEEEESVDEATNDHAATVDDIRNQLETLAADLAASNSRKSKKSRRRRHSRSRKRSTKHRSKKESSDFKRVNQLWDRDIHDYRLQETNEEEESEFADYAFLVRRRFDWENKYLSTVVDIKSKNLKTALAVIMKECKSVSLDADEPEVDPNLLFLYVEQIRTYYKKTLKAQIKKEKKKKAIKKLQSQRSLCKSLVAYIDEDYADVKKKLYPLIEAGNITFDLVWALFNPNEIVITSTYGVWDEPRCFKAEQINKYNSFSRGEYYCIEGQYMEYDGKGFGYAEYEAEIDSFKGPRKINSLAAYPLRFHKSPEEVKNLIVARGKRFVEMEGVHYKFHKGLAFHKKKKQVLKINVNSRCMVDPAIFRRINANYQVSVIRPKDSDDLFDMEDDSNCSCCDDEEEEDQYATGKANRTTKAAADEGEPKVMYKWVQTPEGCYQMIEVEVDENGNPIRNRVDHTVDTSNGKNRSFTEEDLLLTSSVVLGFAFSEKLWLEFSLSGVKDIDYNEKAYESLVLPPNQKSIVRALVESHKFNAAKTIDDVVQGKGKGMVAVLHGPPGTGKTLTAEGISELLKCPLYMVSAGELGTDPARLEMELQKILDIAHSWGAVLLLDEADVFLEKRETHDIHRNALVSIFLRLLEYFQGILFLTTNRVETFDDAFQSRIHVALRYGELTTKAKRSVWTMFLDMCRKQEACEVADFTDADLDRLSRHSLNGRQIKNLVRTAQALALHEKTMLDMGHILKVLDVAETFDRDLRGGLGYVEAMRSYT